MFNILYYIHDVTSRKRRTWTLFDEIPFNKYETQSCFYKFGINSPAFEGEITISFEYNYLGYEISNLNVILDFLGGVNHNLESTINFYPSKSSGWNNLFLLPYYYATWLENWHLRTSR